jgi:hypothetical protein
LRNCFSRPLFRNGHHGVKADTGAPAKRF